MNSFHGEDSDPEDLFESRTKILNRPQIMQNLIGAINKIQDAFNTLKVPNSIELPQIVMLGSQVKFISILTECFCNIISHRVQAKVLFWNRLFIVHSYLADLTLLHDVH